MDELTAFQRDLLYVIAEFDEPHGLAIKKAIQEYYAAEINHGRLYPNLDDLAEQGLVDKGTLDDRTNSYTLTRRGREVLEERRAWEDERISTVFEAASPPAAGDG